MENVTKADGMSKGPANHVALTPLSHLARARDVFADRVALIYGEIRLTYAEYAARIDRLAHALTLAGVGRGDAVATILPNVPAQSEAAFAVPACGAVLNTINTRLDPDTIAYILDHGGARVVIIDSQLVPLIQQAVAMMTTPAPRIIEVPDATAGIPASGMFETYDDFMARGQAGFDWVWPADEWDDLALNYTSGTTGRPKGVVYHHRGAYLMTMGTPISWRMTLFPVVLQIVPLFHCNGWCHTWMTPLLGGTVVCCRDITAAAIYDAIADHGVTHFGGAPIVLNLIVTAKDAARRPFDHTVEVFTAGAPPAAATLAAIEKLGFNVTQVYGLTETYGHVTECIWSDAWNDLPEDERATIKARQGVGFAIMDGVAVVDPDMQPVPRDGQTQGEIVMRGNAVMKGYLKNPEATAAAFDGGWFHSGDLAVQHPDGYIQIVDRAKDIIISGGENISSVEVESALMHHPAVSLCAVVAKPDDTWGEVPAAFVELRDGAEATAQEIIAFARSRLAGFKCPKQVIFGELPKTSTGKIQKFALRQQAAAL
ncbi:fatty-acyl-CoA synthase [Loktanella sp. DSM 29012]|uniref:AMP-binding protein n=1 Tax=Loktanella sp. DSM 29012 TaxID=1881056 RepID=UPI0008B4C2A9|nr:AMP-binding protein [Loktanella sp. DSM 29012]SEQ61497.1 fatty-acyl-CoA synthase [Loktanella sp. DSM 29012]